MMRWILLASPTRRRRRRRNRRRRTSGTASPPDVHRATRSGESGVCLSRADGTHAVRLTQRWKNGLVIRVSWSPGGKYAAFVRPVRYWGRLTNNLVVADSTGRVLRPVVRDFDDRNRRDRRARARSRRIDAGLLPEWQAARGDLGSRERSRVVARRTDDRIPARERIADGHRRRHGRGRAGASGRLEPALLRVVAVVAAAGAGPPWRPSGLRLNPWLRPPRPSNRLLLAERSRLYSAGHGRPQAKDIQGASRQAPSAALDLAAARERVPYVPSSEAAPSRVPELPHVQGA